MNTKRLKTLINIMTRVRDNKKAKFDIKRFQEFAMWGDVVKTEKQALECGTACCVAGWLAISPEFKGLGGRVDQYGEPIFELGDGAEAVKNYLQSTGDVAHNICGFVVDSVDDISYDGGETFYGKNNPDAHLVVKKLTELYNSLTQTKKSV